MNELAVFNPDEKMSGCSLKLETLEEKKLIFNAVSNPDHRVSDMIGKKITIKDVYIEHVDLENKETGEIHNVPRVILIDKKGETYAAVSVGIYSALKKLFAIFGPPTYEEGLTVEVRQVKIGVNSVLTLKM